MFQRDYAPKLETSPLFHQFMNWLQFCYKILEERSY